MGGGGKSEAEDMYQMGSAASLMSALQSKELYEMTAPLRESMYGQWAGMTGGNMPYPNVWNTVLSAARRPIEEQYGRARENIMATVPTGGGMYEDLADVEKARAASFGAITSDYLQDQINKMYGAAWQTPTLTIAGLGNVGQTGIGAAQSFGQGSTQGAGVMGNICAFIFTEGDRMTDNVRSIRDFYFPKGGIVETGYRRMAKWLVPIMAKNIFVKRVIRFIMLDPICTIADYHFGHNSYGWMLKPVGYFWKTVWQIMGCQSRKVGTV